MNDIIEFTKITCPSCWTQFEISIDCSEGSQDCYEDCPVCCSPVCLHITIGMDSHVLGAEATPGNT